MSLLLDALKKSEVQRRRGKAPAVDLATTPPASGRRRPGPRWLIVLLLGVMLGAAALWLWPEISSLFEPRQVADDNEAVSDGDVGTAPVEPSGQAEAPTGPSSASNRPAGVESSEPRRVDGPAPVAGAANARRAPDSETAAAGESATGEEGGPREPTDRPDPQEARSVAREAEPEASQRRQQDGPDVQQAPQEQGARQPEPKPEPEPRENFIRPWELPLARRADFPDLDLSVHFFAERPRDRFVLINGERYTEGQQVESGVVLAEIRRRGAVVEFGSYRVLIE